MNLTQDQLIKALKKVGADLTDDINYYALNLDQLKVLFAELLTNSDAEPKYANFAEWFDEMVTNANTPEYQRSLRMASHFMEMAFNAGKATQTTNSDAEPVACMYVNDSGECEEIGHLDNYNGIVPGEFKPLYVHPHPTVEESEKAELVKKAAHLVNVHECMSDSSSKRLENDILALAGSTSHSKAEQDAECYRFIRPYLFTDDAGGVDIADLVLPNDECLRLDGESFDKAVLEAIKGKSL